MSADPTSTSRTRDGGYVVLARRYRPSQFTQVIGQGHVARTLNNAITQDRVHHAYLFTGSRGVGKTTVARILAKALNCDHGASAEPCDSCDSCVDIREGRSVDVYEIDGASHTGVDDVRELRESVRYMPARSRHKIFIIDEVHMLSTSAFNALLKTLEEPPPQVVFIFATTEPHKIPATILSRCQRFDFKRVPGRVLVEHLAGICSSEGIAVEPEGLALIARASEGSVRDSLSLLDQVFAYDVSGEGAITAAQVAEVLGVSDRRVLFDLSRAVLGRDPGAALGLVEELFSGGQDLSQFAQAFLAHLRDLTVVRTCKDPAALVDSTEAELADMRAICSSRGAELLPQHFDRFARTAEEVARSSFPRLILEMALIEMVHAEPLLPLGDLLERLEQLEGRLPGPGGPPRGPSGGGSRGFGAARDPARGEPGGPGGRPGASARAQAPGLAGRAPDPEGPLAAGRADAAAEEQPAQGKQSPPPRAAAPAAQGSKPPPAALPQPQAPRAAEAAAAPPPAAEPEEPGVHAGAHRGPVPDPLPLPHNGDAMQAWQDLLRRVESVEPMAASAFFSGKLISWSGSRIQLGYVAGSFELELLDRARLSTFRQESSRQTGCELDIEILQLSSAELAEQEEARSALDDRARQRIELRRQLRREAHSHPIVQALLDDFGAEIESITTEADEP